MMFCPVRKFPGRRQLENTIPVAEKEVSFGVENRTLGKRRTIGHQHGLLAVDPQAQKRRQEQASHGLVLNSNRTAGPGQLISAACCTVFEKM